MFFLSVLCMYFLVFTPACAVKSLHYVQIKKKGTRVVLFLVPVISVLIIFNEKSVRTRWPFRVDSKRSIYSKIFFLRQTATPV
uniref:Putative secreted protein n=1 Tax=Rhipicephalus microplus TaxID=6941 RepID=A0A6M2DDF8_RHIMP